MAILLVLLSVLTVDVRAEDLPILEGIFVDRNSQAQVAGCVITANAGDGIRGTRGAAVDIGTDAARATPQFDDDTNVGTNGGFGVSCTIAGFVDGRLGALAGASGGKSSAKACVDNVMP